MSKPTPGRTYVVRNGDTVTRIAAIAYGDAGRASEILRANQAVNIVPGVTLIIPADAQQQAVLPDSDGLAIVIGGREVPTESMRLFRSLDNLANGWTAVIARQPETDPELEELIRPYRFTDANAFINKQIAITGRLYNTSPGLAGRNQASLEGWSLAADMVDSTLKPPYEANKVTLEQRVKDVAATFNLSVTSDLEVDGQFDRVTATAGQKAGEHVLGLASQRGALINSDPDNTLRIFKVRADGVPVGTIEEGSPGFSGFAATFDGRNRFNSYRFLSQTPGDSSAAAVSIDDAVPVTRFTTFSANDTTTGETQAAADWRKTKALADALTIPIQADGLTAPNGKIWTPGQFVTLVSPTLFMPSGFLMLVRSVEMQQASGGVGTTLNLVPPGVYTGGEIAEPWANG